MRAKKVVLPTLSPRMNWNWYVGSAVPMHFKITVRPQNMTAAYTVRATPPHVHPMRDRQPAGGFASADPAII